MSCELHLRRFHFTNGARMEPGIDASKGNRAMARGYISCDRASAAIQVRRQLAPAICSMAASLDLHEKHDKLAGTVCRFAREATLGARELLSEAEFRHAQLVHRKAGRAKHDVSKPGIRHPKSSAALGGDASWADIEDSPCSVDTSASIP